MNGVRRDAERSPYPLTMTYKDFDSPGWKKVVRDAWTDKRASPDLFPPIAS